MYDHALGGAAVGLRFVQRRPAYRIAHRISQLQSCDYDNWGMRWFRAQQVVVVVVDHVLDADVSPREAFGVVASLQHGSH